jgi:hypothetical protein
MRLFRLFDGQFTRGAIVFSRIRLPGIIAAVIVGAALAGRWMRAIGAPQEVVTAQMLSAIYRTEVIVEDTPSGRRVCVPAWETHPRVPDNGIGPSSPR